MWPRWIAAILIPWLAAICPLAAAELVAREFVVSGIGITVGVDRFWKHSPTVFPVMGWYDPGDARSIFSYGLFPCKAWSCKEALAGLASVGIRRLEMPDAASDENSEDHLRLRMETIRGLAERELSNPRLRATNTNRADYDSLRYLKFSNGNWASVQLKNASGKPTGATYYRMLGGDMLLGAILTFEPSMLPSNVSATSLLESFDEFVSNIKIDGQVRPQRSR